VIAWKYGAGAGGEWYLGGLSNITKLSGHEQGGAYVQETPELWDIYIDCLGDHECRNYSNAIRDDANIILFQVPFNFGGDERATQFVEALLNLWAFPGARVIFVCAMGEKRSAATLGTSLCVLHAFHAEAAKAHVESSRRRAEISYYPFNNVVTKKTIPPAFDEMRKLTPILQETLDTKIKELEEEAQEQIQNEFVLDQSDPTPGQSLGSFGSSLGSSADEVVLTALNSRVGRRVRPKATPSPKWSPKGSTSATSSGAGTRR
jgi:hypothetical protein